VLRWLVTGTTARRTSINNHTHNHYLASTMRLKE
jgi:hypothetical protein